MSADWLAGEYTLSHPRQGSAPELDEMQQSVHHASFAYPVACDVTDMFKVTDIEMVWSDFNHQ